MTDRRYLTLHLAVQSLRKRALEGLASAFAVVPLASRN